MARGLWFQPIHPDGIAGRQNDPATDQPFEVGTPSAVKNFYEVMRLMAKVLTSGGTPATNDIMLDACSHDEDHYQNPWQALIRHAANHSVDGVRLVFPGQLLGLSGTTIPPNNAYLSLTPYGYDRYEINSGKPISHFKKYNSVAVLVLGPAADSDGDGQANGAECTAGTTPLILRACPRGFPRHASPPCEFYSG